MRAMKVAGLTALVAAAAVAGYAIDAKAG